MVAPAALPPPAASAWTIEYRALDRCFVPACAIQSRGAIGWLNELQSDGDPGSYAQNGSAAKQMLYRRATFLRADGEMVFDLPASEDASELDFYLGGLAPGPWKAELRISDVRVGAAPVAIETRPFVGRTVDADTLEFGVPMDEPRVWQHQRIPLPSRRGRTLRVTLKNTGERALMLGNPLVMRRVPRQPRQLVVTVFDMVPHPYMHRFFTDGLGDPRVAYMPKLDEAQGVFFSGGQSPGMNTATFMRRFFRPDFFETAGEPVLAGLGIDESPPPRVSSILARLAERGFMVEAMGDAFNILPNVTRLGFDGGYQTEDVRNPTWLPKRFGRWMNEHIEDDSVVVVWFSNTHSWELKRPGVTPKPAPVPDGLTEGEILPFVNRVVGDAGENFEHFAEMRASVAQSSARRIWFLGADHGTAFHTAAREQVGRQARSGVVSMTMHGVWATADEAETPFALLFDGGGRPAGFPTVWTEPVSDVVTWRAVEETLGVDLGLTDTSMYAMPFGRRDALPPWDDRGIFNVGNAGAVRLRVGPIAYRNRRPSFQVAPLYSGNAATQRMFGGTDRARDGILAEELYDHGNDRYEKTNVAPEHFDRVLDMRRRLADFYAAHDVPPKHRRTRYKLTFASRVEVTLHSPRPFDLIADDKLVVREDARWATVQAKQIEIIDREKPTRIIEISGPATAAPLVLRCGSSGAPLDQITAERSRFDLGTAAHNCPQGSPSTANLRPGDVAFDAGPAPSIGPESSGLGDQAAGGTGNNDAFMAGMKRWGYVRDIEKK